MQKNKLCKSGRNVDTEDIIENTTCVILATLNYYHWENKTIKIADRFLIVTYITCTFSPSYPI